MLALEHKLGRASGLRGVAAAAAARRTVICQRDIKIKIFLGLHWNHCSSELFFLQQNISYNLLPLKYRRGV
jgi:hypothetical protein